MGKWAQYKRRGSSGAATHAPLGPPAAPQLLLVDSEMLSEDLGPYNVGGVSRLYQAPAAIGPWTLYAFQVWDIDVTWGPTEHFEDYFYRATSVGNGTNFVGESIPSNVLDLT